MTDSEKREEDKKLLPLKAKLAGGVAIIIAACLAIWKMIHQ